MPAEGVHASIKAIQDMEAACARFARALSERLPEIEREIRRVSEALDDRRKQLRREVAELRETISSARKDDDVDRERHRLNEAEEELAAVQRRVRKVEETCANYKRHARNAENIASDQTAKMRGFLDDAADRVKMYLASEAPASGQSSASSSSGRDQSASKSSASELRAKIRGANYTSAEKYSGGINVSYRLKNGISVMFKPMAGEYPIQAELPPGITKWTQYRREKAASIVDEILGTGLVPPTEIIKYDNLEGSAQLFKEDFSTAAKLHENSTITLPIFGQLTERQRQDWNLIDEVIGNVDRHSNNWMLRVRPDNGFDVVLIDHGYCFPAGIKPRLKERPASGLELDVTSRSRLERFLALEKEWRPEMVGLLGIAAVEDMIHRAQNLLFRNKYE